MSDKVWNEVTRSDSHDFEIEKSLVGVYILKEEKVGSNESNLYHFEREDGKQVTVWGSAVIDSRMLKVPIGTEVKIEFLGMKKNPKTNRSFKDYKIYCAG